MTLEQKLAVLKDYKPTDYYLEGKYIDGVDTVTQWCLAQVVTLEGNTISIHFDGWSNRWDVVSFNPRTLSNA
jgi:hypothetical protein